MNKPKRILVDARIIGTGTGDYLEGLLNELQKVDRIREYIIVLDPEAKWAPSANNFTAYSSRNTSRKDIFFIKGNINLAWELYKLKADVFFGGFQHIPFFYFNKKSILLIFDLTQVRIKNLKSRADKKMAWSESKKVYLKDKLRKLPFSLIPNSLLMKMFNFFSLRLSVKRVKQIIVISKFVQNDVINYFKLPKEKVVVAYNGEINVNLNVKQTKVKKLVGKDFVFYLGTDFAHKNVNILVEVLDLLREKKTDLHLVFAGRKDRNYTMISLRAKELGLEDRVHVLGFVSAEEKTWLFRHAKLYVFPSLSEGFGIPALEAMAYGLPVLASNRTAIPEVCGDAAVYFDPTSKEDISNTILRTIDNEKLKAELIQKGYERNKLFKWEDSAKVVLEEINKL
jgi:glycosyltransferase involved in cell wall biosynthesis